VVSRPPPQPRPTQPASTETKDVVLNGVAFESSGRSLVRKDRKFLFSVSLFQTLWRDSPPVTTPALSVPKPPSSGPSNPRVGPSQSTSQPFTRKSGHLIPTTRVYKPKQPSRGRRGRNMTLNNSTRTSYQSVPNKEVLDFCYLIHRFHRSRRATNKRLKYSDKPCPRFTTTGARPGFKKIRSFRRLLKAFPFLFIPIHVHHFFCSFYRLMQPWSYVSLST
jgi:hypothetical protein